MALQSDAPKQLLKLKITTSTSIQIPKIMTTTSSTATLTLVVVHSISAAQGIRSNMNVCACPCVVHIYICSGTTIMTLSNLPGLMRAAPSTTLPAGGSHHNHSIDGYWIGNAYPSTIHFCGQLVQSGVSLVVT